MIEIKNSKIDGKGVFATKQIKTGEIIEFDVLKISKKEIPFDLVNHYFPFSGNEGCIVIGPPTFMNHSKIPNIRILDIDKINLKKRFVFIQDIEIGDEIFLYYNDKFNKMIND